MGIAVKKQIIRDLKYFETQFATVQIAASEYERHERTNRQKQFFALEKIFEFGKEITDQPDVFEAFLKARKLPLNKTTQDNPYNALVQLAFENPPSKSWHSQCSNVLHYAMYEAGNTPLSEWLKIDGGVTERYKQSVSYFSRTASTKAKRLKSARLQMAEQQYSSVAGKPALPGVPTLAKGFYRSLVYSDGASSYVVDIRDGDQDAVVEKYLLDLVRSQHPPSHPLAEKALFRFFRAIDLTCGLCGLGGANERRFIGLWNETIAGVETTKVTILSDAYIFTNTTITLAEPVAALTGKGKLLLSWADAEVFRADFSKNDDWQFNVRDSGVWLENNAKPKTELQLQPVAMFNVTKLRMGVKPTRQCNHFMASITKMDAAIKKNNEAAIVFKKKNAKHGTSLSMPNKFKWVTDRNDAMLEIDQPQTFIDPSYDFMDFSTPAMPLVPDRYISIADMRRLWTVIPAFGEDKRGYIGDSDVADAAFCIDDTFEDDDHILYLSPMIIGNNKKDRTQVCEDFVAATVSVAASGPKVISPSKSPTSSMLLVSHTPAASSTSQASAISHEASPRNYKLIEKNRRRKTSFPATPSSSRRAFGAFITSYLPDDAEHRADRKFDFEWQLEWWRCMTDIPVHVIASNWTDEEIAASKELGLLSEHGGGITRVGPRILIENRIDCLKQLYESDFDWGIIMDDDAVLMQAENHNSSYQLFAEMAAKGKAAYDGVDLFAPIYGRKAPFNKELNGPGNPYSTSHVFKKNTDLKGSMIVVRNFAKDGRPLLLPDPSFRCHGEDAYLVLQAISLGYSTMTSWNMVLEELSGESTFANGDDERTEKMREGHELLVAKFGQLGLRMKTGSHALDKKQFETRCWGEKSKRIDVPKP